jgi:DNA-binding Xre family transcriptional regulator
MNVSECTHDVIQKLNEPRINLMALSRLTGVSYTLLREFRSGKRKNITVNTLAEIITGLSKL